METVADFNFEGAPKLLQMVIATMKLKDTFCLKESFDQLWGFSPRDLEMTNLKEQHSDILLQGLTNLFLQSNLFIEKVTKSLEYMASRVRTGLRHNQ